MQTVSETFGFAWFTMLLNMLLGVGFLSVLVYLIILATKATVSLGKIAASVAALTQSTQRIEETLNAMQRKP
jgi:phosphate starvation-inducible membrane PsiE